MNMPDLTMINPTLAVTILSLLVLSIALLVGACARAMGRRRELDSRVAQLQQTLLVYTEAATSVAQTLDQILLDRVPQGQKVHSSRRYLLVQARGRLLQGESSASVQHGLGLSHDEVQLLQRSTPGDRQAVQPADIVVSESGRSRAA